MLRSAQCNGLSCSCGFCGVVEGFFISTHETRGKRKGEMGVGPWNGATAAGVLPGCRRQFLFRDDRKIGDVRTVGVRHKGQQRQQTSGSHDNNGRGEQSSIDRRSTWKAVTLMLRAPSVIYVPRPACLDLDAALLLPLRHQYQQHSTRKNVRAVRRPRDR